MLTAELIYNMALDHIVSVVGPKAMFGDDLERVARTLIGPEFAGVFPVDKIHFPKGTKYAIFNLDKRRKRFSCFTDCS